jgi:hypothetical protein
MSYCLEGRRSPLTTSLIVKPSDSKVGVKPGWERALAARAQLSLPPRHLAGRPYQLSLTENLVQEVARCQWAQWEASVEHPFCEEGCTVEGYQKGTVGSESSG